jgi:glucose-6-phosphate dehydrogenase assembly protein OpcA
VGVVADVERELAGLWRDESSTEESVVRACAHNLVVVCDGGTEEVSAIVARLSESAPGRALVVTPSESDGGLRPYVSAHCHLGAGGKQVCCEQVTLEVGRDGIPLVPGSILQLLVEEMPVFTWWRRRGLEDDGLLAPLRDLSDCLIVDGARFVRPAEDLDELRRVAAKPGWKGHVTDLAWERLEPWRDAIASLFDIPRMRRYLGAIERVTVAAAGPGAEDGLTTAGAYVVGWLASRLDWTPGDDAGRWRASDRRRVILAFERDSGLAAGEVASVRLEAILDGLPVTFVVRRVEAGSAFVVSTVEVRDTCPLPRKIELPERDEAALLCGALQEPARDPLFDAALEAAARRP